MFSKLHRNLSSQPLRTRAPSARKTLEWFAKRKPAVLLGRRWVQVSRSARSCGLRVSCLLCGRSIAILSQAKTMPVLANNLSLGNRQKVGHGQRPDPLCSVLAERAIQEAMATTMTWTAKSAFRGATESK